MNANDMRWFMEALEDDELPKPAFKKEVCPTCNGEGTTWHGFGYNTESCSFTESEWYELDDEDRDGYMSGRYDRLCPECEGRNVIDEIDETHTDPRTVEKWHAWCHDIYESRAIERMESMMGA